MNDLQQYIDEYGVPEPVPEAYASYDLYDMAYRAWFDGLTAYVNQRWAEEEAARIAAEKEAALQKEEADRQQAAAEAAAQQAREEEEARAAQALEQLPKDEPGTSDRYQIGSYIDAAGNIWSSSGELLSGNGALTDSYVDQAGHLWLMEHSNPAEQAEVVTGEPTVDTAMLLLELLDALAGEEGMTDDVDGIQETVEGIRQALEHPVMTTSFQDYTVTEGLLLLLLLSVFVAACAKMLKEGFAWLR